ncbi:short-chain dehydrogenase reductase 3b [Canna indica]|uniref:Short-chain dehydrogenase reductase 3b n=1 Tax=Canna indica TaxID=4628 RepID=A0AAQ3K948_9LILI|nr:short-chain dehydrogenase reductase 3b [Canna indica]
MAAAALRKLQGKVAIITGGSGGMGEASARLFAAHGARVVIGDVKDELGAGVAASIGHDKCCYRSCDLRDESQVEALVKHAVDTFGRLDVMYANAAIVERPDSIAKMSLEDLDNVMAVNVRGTAATIKHAARAMLASGTRGSIVCTASVAAIMVRVRTHAYTASKHGVLGLVKSAAAELGQHGIRVNCVSPTGVATPMAVSYSGLGPEAFEKSVQEIAMLKGVVLKAHHIAEAALFLASEESAFITGHNLVVDGGITVVGPPTLAQPK